jgi:enoyl-CoA hydratase
MNRLEALPLPVLAIVQGYAMGGGLELAMACDLIYASQDARFGQSEAKLGLVTGWGGCYRLSRRVGLARAKELAFTGRIFDGVEAQAMGLTTWCGPGDRLESAVKTFVDAVAANSRTALRETKTILATCETTTLAENAEVEAAASERCLMHGDAPLRLEEFFAARRSRLPLAK